MKKQAFFIIFLRAFIETNKDKFFWKVRARPTASITNKRLLKKKTTLEGHLIIIRECPKNTHNPIDNVPSCAFYWTPFTIRHKRLSSLFLWKRYFLLRKYFITYYIILYAVFYVF